MKYALVTTVLVPIFEYSVELVEDEPCLRLQTQGSTQLMRQRLKMIGDTEAVSEANAQAPNEKAKWDHVEDGEVRLQNLTLALRRESRKAKNVVEGLSALRWACRQRFNS